MGGGSVLPMVNRCLLVVWAKAPFIEWLQGLPDQPRDFAKELTLKSVNANPPCFLIPNDCDSDSALEHYLPLIKHEIFSAWCTHEELWPRKLGLKEFSKWFDVTWATGLHDCNSREPLDYEE